MNIFIGASSREAFYKMNNLTVGVITKFHGDCDFYVRARHDDKRKKNIHELWCNFFDVKSFWKWWDGRFAGFYFQNKNVDIFKTYIKTMDFFSKWAYDTLVDAQSKEKTIGF